MNYFTTKYHYLKEENIPKMCSEGWLIMKKYKGIQAIWDGGVTRKMDIRDVNFSAPRERKKISTGLWSIGRDGFPHPISAPNEWLNCLPKGIPLCGELWNNDKESEVLSIISGKNNDVMSIYLWQTIKFVPFNIRPYMFWSIPNYNDDYLSNKPFIEHFEIILNLCKSEKYKYLWQPTFLQLDITNWKLFKKFVRENQWEGLILQRLSAKYETGTSYNTLKWKQEYDCECTVVGYNPGEDKYKGMTGSLRVKTRWGSNILTMLGGESSYMGMMVNYKVSGGLTDEDRANPSLRCKIGTELKLKFNSITSHGKPQHAKIDWSK